MEPFRLFHVSEDADIKIFIPRPSAFYANEISGNVVFAISEKLLHNYLFPRECPRVTCYAGDKTSQSDKDKFFGQSSAEHIIGVEKKWLPAIRQTKLYCYQFCNDCFSLLDECANYYISYQPAVPVSVMPVDDLVAELFKRNIELRFLPNLWHLADEVVKSSLNYSLIRMRNAIPPGKMNGRSNG